MYKICLIDEQNDIESTVDGFLDEFLKSQRSIDYELLYIDPNNKEIEEVINIIIESNSDLVLIDYVLITYNGGDIISDLNLKNPKLPKVILTNDPDDFEESQIGFRAIDKADIDTEDIDGKGTKLIELIIKSIESYKENLHNIQKEFDILHDLIEDKKITPKKLERFIELDEEITKTYGLSTQINSGILDKTDIGELQEIITLAKRIIEK